MQTGRGEGWVIAQFIILAIIALIPPDLAGLPALPEWCRPLGVAVGLLGGGIGVAGLLGLGSNLTPFPRPKDDATLVETGVYAIVRHPIYAGLFVATVGYALLRASLPTLLLSLALGVFFDQKARREERWLEQKFPQYAAYQQKVRGRILPF